MWHRLILELCQNTTVTSVSKRELIFLHPPPLLFAAIVPVTPEHLNWLSWRWFWAHWKKAAPREGNLPKPLSSVFASLLPSPSSLWNSLALLLSHAQPFAITLCEATVSPAGLSWWWPAVTLQAQAGLLWLPKGLCGAPSVGLPMPPAQFRGCVHHTPAPKCHYWPWRGA